MNVGCARNLTFYRGSALQARRSIKCIQNFKLRCFGPAIYLYTFVGIAEQRKTSRTRNRIDGILIIAGAVINSVNHTSSRYRSVPEIISVNLLKQNMPSKVCLYTFTGIGEPRKTLKKRNKFKAVVFTKRILGC